MEPVPVGPLPMFPALEHPHRSGFARALEPAFTVERDRLRLGDQDVLVKSAISLHQSFHQLSSNAPTLELGQHQEMRVIHDQVSIRNGVSQAYERALDPGRDDGMRALERAHEMS